MGSYAHGRTPGSGAAGGIDLQGAEALQSICEVTEGTADEPGKREDLSAVGVAGELEADAGLFDLSQAAGRGIEQNAGVGGGQAQGLENGAYAEDGGGVAVGHAQDVEAIDGHPFVGQNADAGAGDHFMVFSRAAVLLVVAGGEVDAEGRGEIFEGSGQAVRVCFGTVEEVAGEEDDVRTEAGGEGHDTPGESETVDVAQMKIAEQECCAATPGLGQVGEIDVDAPNANPAGIEQAIDAGHEGQGKEDGGDEGAAARQG